VSLPDMTPDQLLAGAREIAEREPGAVLVKNGVGNLAILRGGEMLGWLDLRYGTVHWSDDGEVSAEFREQAREFMDRNDELLRRLALAGEPSALENRPPSLTEEDLRPGCGHLPDAHEGGRPATTLYCRNCPDGICYAWTPGSGEVGPGALPHSN
jgi:hypothetical protein